MHTEGSILFSDPVVYDRRVSRDDGWRWDKVKELLDPTKSEVCNSSLFQLIPITFRNNRSKSKDKKNHRLDRDVLSFAKAHIDGWDSLNEFIGSIANEHSEYGFTTEALTPQVEFYSQILSSVESFLLSNWDIENIGASISEVVNLAEQTFAYFSADEEKQEQIMKLFKILADNISNRITDRTRRKVFSKTLYGVNDAIKIEEWVRDNAVTLLAAQSEGELFDITWPLIADYIHNRTFNKFDRKNILKEIAKQWISGTPFFKLFQIADKNACRLGKGKSPRKVKIENIVDICESGIAYDGALLVSAICEFVEFLDRNDTSDLIDQLQTFQKRLKYGLPEETAVALYELGFSDRVISQDLTTSIKLTSTQGKDLVGTLKQNKKVAKTVLRKYPSYFQDRLNQLVQ